MGNTLRTVVVQGTTYRVNRLYSSGLGAQYACTTKDSDGKEKTILISEATVDQDPSQTELFKACERRFDDSLSFAKHIGSSSFWQSQTPPDGIGKRK